MKLERWLEWENSHLGYWFGTREITVLLWTDGDNWQGELAISLLGEYKKFTVSDALCNIRLTLSMIDFYRKMRYLSVCVMNFFFLVICCKIVVLRCFDTLFQRPYRYFSIALKVFFSLSDRYKIFTSNWLKMCVATFTVLTLC